MGDDDDDDDLARAGIEARVDDDDPSDSDIPGIISEAENALRGNRIPADAAADLRQAARIIKRSDESGRPGDGYIPPEHVSGTVAVRDLNVVQRLGLLRVSRLRRPPAGGATF